MTWYTGALFTNPSANTVVCDTGPLVAGYWQMSLILSANTGLELIWQHRDAANETTLRSKIIPVTLSILHLRNIFPVEVNANERCRLITRADVVGEVEGSIFALQPSSLGAP